MTGATDRMSSLKDSGIMRSFIQYNSVPLAVRTTGIATYQDISSFSSWAKSPRDSLKESR